MGDLGEILWNEAHKDKVHRQDGYKSDFIVVGSASGLELKTDFYSMDKTPNFFFERFSNRETQSPGGPHQALQNGSRYFVYFFIKNLTYFLFETAPLVERLNNIIPNLTPVNVENKSWTTEGFRVPRDSVSDLYKEVKLTVTIAPGCQHAI